VPFQTINGLDLYYELYGDSGEPVVLVHGYTGDLSDWRHQQREFSSTHRVLALDNRGHGRSAAPADRSAYTVAHMAGDVEALIDSLGFQRYHLVGHSMGGAIAQEIALRSQQRLLSLTLHATSPSFDLDAAIRDDPRVRAYVEYRRRLAETEGMAAVAGMPALTQPPPHQDPDRAAEKDRRLAGMSLDAFLGAWDGLLAWPGTAGRASAIQTPTLVLYGDLDNALIVEGCQALARLIPNARLEVIPEAGHQPQEERPDLYNAALRPFLQANAAAPIEQGAG
jgi:pimeloyl-ACP methyl ester carboxylesterase